MADKKGGVTLGGIWSFPARTARICPAPPAQLGEMSRNDPSLSVSGSGVGLNLNLSSYRL